VTTIVAPVRARGERTLVYGMQSSGATLAALLLAQRADSVALLDVYCGRLVPARSAFPAEHTAIAKVTFSSVCSFEEQRARFEPDRTVLVLRHPCHAYVSLLRKPYAAMGGTPDEKLIRFEQAFRDRASFDAVVRYEDLVFRAAVALDELRVVDPTLAAAALDFTRSPTEIVAAARRVPALDTEHLSTWARGNADARGLDPRRVFKVVPADLRRHVESLCPEATASFDEYYAGMFSAWRVGFGGWWDDAIYPRVRTTASKSREAARRAVHAGRQ
jgi:hypothetical protein